MWLLKKQVRVLFIANHLEIVRRLIEAGIHVHAKNRFGNNALFVATARTDLAILRLPAESGVSPDEANQYGVSPRQKFAQRTEMLAAMTV